MKETQKQDSRGLWFLLIGAVCALLCFALTVGALLLSDLPTQVPVIIGFLLLSISEAAVMFLYVRTARPEQREEDPSVQKLIQDVLKKYSGPVVIVRADGQISWTNNLMQELLAENDCLKKPLEAVLGVSMSELTAADVETGYEVALFGSRYRVRSYLMPTNNLDFWMLFFENRAEYLALEERISLESPVLVYAVIDNADKINQFVRTSSREASNRIELILTSWAAAFDGFIREYDRDKYMIQFPKQRLQECVDTGFSVLNDIRNATAPVVGVPLTVSMGVSVCGTNVRERENDAASALETALQRGGDQVVFHDGAGRFAYFGGKTKTDISHTRITTRTVGAKIEELIRGAGNVLIMGHSRPDFDSIGSCIGLYRMAQAFHENVRIVIDRQDPNFLVCTDDLLEKQPEYDRVFISGEEGLELLRSDTLLLISDTNNMKIVECPELVRNTATQVIIDHHRKLEEFEVQPVISIIEPGTSSASELVSEILEFSAAANVEREDALCLTPEEANVMLSGIMLDTKNFTRCTGEETYAAAMFLRTHGADSEKARTYFSNDEASFTAEARLSANAFRVRDRILLTGEQIAGGAEKISAKDRILASRVAESLLTLKDVDAAFAMCYTDTEVLISGRSNGKINVQLILESLGGGGRFDAAGAQISGRSFHVVAEELKVAINRYLDADTAAEKTAEPTNT